VNACVYGTSSALVILKPIERVGCAQVAERAPVGGGVARADLENDAVRQLDANDVVVVHRRAVWSGGSDDDDGVVLDAVDEITDLESAIGGSPWGVAMGVFGRSADAPGAPRGAASVHGRRARRLVRTTGP